MFSEEEYNSYNRSTKDDIERCLYKDSKEY